MIIKVILKTKIKIIKLDVPSFARLKEEISKSFPEAPANYILTYFDVEGDEITLLNEHDIDIVHKLNLKAIKIYIKDNLSTTIVIKPQNTEEIDISMNQSILDKSIKIDEKLKGQKEEFNLPSQSKQMSFKRQIIKLQNVQKQQILQHNQFNAQKNHKEHQPPREVLKQNIKINEQNDMKNISVLLKDDINQQAKVQRFKQSKQVEKSLVYHSAICFACKDQFGIIGVRYQCIFCPNYNLCQTCEEKVSHIHSLVKIKKQGMQITTDQILKHFHVEHPQPPFFPPPPPPTTYELQKLRYQLMSQIQKAKKSFNEGIAKGEKTMYEAFEKLQQKVPNPPPKEVNPYVWGFPNKPSYANSLGASYNYQNDRNYYQNDPILLNAVYLSQQAKIAFAEALQYSQKYPKYSNKMLLTQYLNSIVKK